MNRADGFLYTYSASAVSLRVITVIFIRKKAIYSIYITYIKCINIYTDKRSQSTPQGVSAGPRLESPPAAAARYRLLRRSRAGRAGLRAGLLGVRSAPGDPPPLDPLRCGSLEATGPGAAPSTVLPPPPSPKECGGWPPAAAASAGAPAATVSAARAPPCPSAEGGGGGRGGAGATPSAPCLCSAIHFSIRFLMVGHETNTDGDEWGVSEM